MNNLTNALRPEFSGSPEFGLMLRKVISTPKLAFHVILLHCFSSNLHQKIESEKAPKATMAWKKPAVSQQAANPHFRLALCSRAENGNAVMPLNKCNRRSVQKHARKASQRAHKRKCALRGHYAQYIVPFSSAHMQ